jgi:uncharacterized membrane protein YqhA
MKRVIQHSRYLNIVIVILLLITFIFALIWAGARAVTAWLGIVSGAMQGTAISLQLIEVMDAFLVAIVLYLLATGIYELFIGDLALPDWMEVHSLNELESKLTSMIFLVIVVRFLEVLFQEGRSSMDILWLALATAVIGAVLIAFGAQHGGEQKPPE